MDRVDYCLCLYVDIGVKLTYGLGLGLGLERQNMAMRYPKGGRGRSWTIRELLAIPADWKGDTVSDGGGLSGKVRVSSEGKVSIRFEYAFKWEGKVAWFQCGTWPLVDLAQIRANRDEAKENRKSGLNPITAKTAAKIEAAAEQEALVAAQQAEAVERKTVKQLFDAWIADGVARADGNAELIRRFSRDVLPDVGQIELRRLTEHHIRDIVRKKIADDGSGARMADSLYDDIVQMLAWGEKRQPWRGLLIDGNPADLVDMDKILPLDYEEERDRFLSKDEVRELFAALTRLRRDYANAPAGKKYSTVRPLKRESELALYICLGTLCRIGELLMAEWRHVDLQAGIWFIPKPNVKGRRQKKQDHYVFLSAFVSRAFKELHTLTGSSRWLFPASRQQQGADSHVCVKTVTRQVGDRQVQFKDRSKPLSHRLHNNTLVLAGGENGDWTPHDLRRTGATLMQELELSQDIIDLCQNHKIKKRVRRVYQKYDYKAQKTEAWRLLGELLESLFAESTAVETV